MRIVLVLFLCVFTSVSGAAAPLTDYAFGKGSLDLDATFPHTQATDQNGVIEPSGSFGMNNGGEIAFTLGLGANFAFKYDRAASFAPLDGRSSAGNYYYDKSSFDLMYGLKSDVMPLFVTVYFGGLNYEFGFHNAPGVGGAATGYSELGYHLGIMGDYQLFSRITGWLQVAWGSLDTEAEIGLAYNCTKNLDFDLAIEYNALHGNDLFVQQYSDKLFKIRSVIPKAGISLKF